MDLLGSERPVRVFLGERATSGLPLASAVSWGPCAASPTGPRSLQKIGGEAKSTLPEHWRER